METKLQDRAAFNFDKSSEYLVSPVSLLSNSPPFPTVPKRNMSFGYVSPPTAPIRHMSLTIDASNLDATLSESTAYKFPSFPHRKESCVPNVKDLLDSKQSGNSSYIAPLRSTHFIPLNRKDSISSDASTIRDSCSSFEKYKCNPGELPTDTPESPYRQYFKIPIIQKSHPIPSREHVPFRPQLRSSSLIVLTNMQDEPQSWFSFFGF
jgi:hypothetical protein